MELKSVIKCPQCGFEKPACRQAGKKPCPLIPANFSTNAAIVASALSQRKEIAVYFVRMAPPNARQSKIHLLKRCLDKKPKGVYKYSVCTDTLK